MLTQAQTQRYAAESGLRDLMIAEKEIVLTFLLQLLSERGILEKLAFKGGTCIRKMFEGSQGRFSTDLDFTSLRDHDHEDIVLAMMAAFEEPFHGIQFAVPDDSYYETQDGLSWGVTPLMPMTGTVAGRARSSSKSAGAKFRRLRQNPGRSANRLISSLCHSRRRKSPACNCPRLSPRNSAPVTSGTRRAISSILACMRRARSTGRLCAASSC